MGFFRAKTEPLRLPGAGRAIAIDSVPDPLFAGKALGDGFAFEPEHGTIVSPVDGEVVTVAETLHAVGIRTRAGAEVLVHVGIDTVTCKGEGFTAHVAPGERVRAGDTILTVDLDAVAARVPSMASPVVLLNGDAFELTGLDLASDPVAQIRAR